MGQLEPVIERQVRAHIRGYRAQGYSDEQIREALSQKGVDAATVSRLLRQVSFSQENRPFYKRFWFLIPIGVVVLFLLLVLVFLVTEEEKELLEDGYEEGEGEVVEEAEGGTSVSSSECDYDIDCGEGYDCQRGDCVRLSSAQQDEEDAIVECGDGDCSEGEECALDCGCGEDEDCEVYGDYGCSEINECYALGGGAGVWDTAASGSSGTADTGGDAGVISSCVEADCTALGYVCDSSTDACYTSCTYGGDSGECTTGYACDNTSLCSSDSDGDGVADSDEIPYASVTICDGSDEDCDTGEVCSSFVCYEPECSDAIDNDGDGNIDYLGLEGCDVDGDSSFDYTCGCFDGATGGFSSYGDCSSSDLITCVESTGCATGETYGCFSGDEGSYLIASSEAVSCSDLGGTYITVNDADDGCESGSDDSEDSDAGELIYVPEGEQGFFVRIWSWILSFLGVSV